MITGQLKDIPRFIIGAFAMVISLLLLFNADPNSINFIAGLYLLVISAIDTLYSKIPNLCNLALLLAGLTYNFYHFGFPGLWHTFLGLILGLALLLIPYLMGGMGGGDVKALAALGALLGPNQVFQAFFYIGLIGGVLAVFHYLFQKNLWQKVAAASRAVLAFAGTRDPQTIWPQATEKLRFPYAAAFAFGFFCYVNYGDVFSLLPSLLGKYK
jgi:prepilin peptidase CpaA